MAHDEAQTAKALTEIKSLCGIPLTKIIEKEVSNVSNILHGVLPPGS